MKSVKLILTLILSLSYFNTKANLNSRELRLKQFIINKASSIVHEKIDDNFSKEDLLKGLSILSTQNIIIEWNPLLDNRGSAVDMLGLPGSLTVDGNRIEKYIRENIDISILIIHELHRIAGINDDSYHLTKNYLPYLKLDQTSNLYCDLNVSKTLTTIKTKSMNLNVETDAGHYGGAIVINSSVQQQVQNELKRNAQTKCKKKGYDQLHKIDSLGSLAIFSDCGLFGCERLAKLDAKITCSKAQISKRKKRDIKKEACQKANICKDLFNNLSEGQEKEKKLMELFDFEDKNNC